MCANAFPTTVDNSVAELNTQQRMDVASRSGSSNENQTVEEKYFTFQLKQKKIEESADLWRNFNF